MSFQSQQALSYIAQHQRHVYLMVDDQDDLDAGGGSDEDGVMVSLDGVARDEVCIELRYDDAVSRVHHWKYHNPYCMSFKMPDKVLLRSHLVEVRLAVVGVPLGSGKIKCENKMDTIAALLTSVSNAADVMCKSLGLSPVPGLLDHHLAACVRRGLPPFTSDHFFTDSTAASAHRTTARSSSGILGVTVSAATWSRDFSKSKFPTWLHFAAHHGLVELTAALLTVPGWREAVRLPDCDGNTPDRIAQAMGHDNLAERLEYLALMATDESLAAFEAPPNLSDLTINSRCLLPSPHLTPQTDGILRTSPTGSNRSADSFRSISSHSRSSVVCSLSALRAVSGPPKPVGFSRHSTADVLSSTPSSLPAVLPKASSKTKIASQEQDSQALTRCDTSAFNSTNGSALLDSQIMWVQCSQASKSPDSGYLDMTRSDTSAFNRTNGSALLDSQVMCVQRSQASESPDSGYLDMTHSDTSAFNSTNGSALLDSQVMWVQRSQASESPDSGYLDMTRSDTSAFNCSLSMVHVTQSGNDSSTLLTHEQLLNRLNHATFNSTRLHHQSESELHESYIESSSFVVPSEMLEYASLTRSVTLPTYTTSLIYDTDLSANSTSAVDVTSSSSSSPPPNDAEARLNLCFPSESPNLNNSVVNDGSPLGLSETRSLFRSPTVPTIPYPHSSTAAVEGYRRTHERIRFPVNGVDSSARNQATVPNGSLPNLARYGVSGPRPTRLSSHHNSASVPASRASDVEDLTTHSAGTEPVLVPAVQDTRAMQTGSSQHGGVAARLKGFFKARSKQRFVGVRTDGIGHLSPSAHSGDPHNDNVNDPTAVVPRSGSSDALTNGALPEVSVVSSVLAGESVVSHGGSVVSRCGRLLQSPSLVSTSDQLTGVSNALSVSTTQANSHCHFVDSGESSSSTQVSGSLNGHNRLLSTLPISSSHKSSPAYPNTSTFPRPTHSTTSDNSRGFVLSSNSQSNRTDETTSRHWVPTTTRENLSLDSAPAETCARGVQIDSEQPRPPVQSSLQSGHMPLPHKVLNSAPISTYVNTSSLVIASLESA
ncbi:DBB domain [Trinorchestia longiramus]|nr:DBB domain [Trinorchestia longiramus]